MVLQSRVGATLVTEETLGMTLARQEEIIVETLETVISIDLSEKRLLTMIGNVKSVITLIFHLEQNAIDAENPNQVVEATAETADHAETTVLEEREVHEENADHAESVDQAKIVVEVTESVDQEEKEVVAKSETQPFVNSVALEVNHLVMRTTEDPNPLILVH